MLNDIMLGVTFSYFYLKCCYGECHYDKCQIFLILNEMLL
jgi:hypothetical protein